MTVVVYKSTDTSAPTLTGAGNSLVALLDACLVNGYGSKAAAGWSKPFTGTNAAAFRQGSSGFYVNVDDNGPGVGTFKEARLRGYETMSAVATGTGPFPTVAQAANGVFARKSTTADGTTRAWIVVADARTFYVFVLTGDTTNLYYSFGFGDFYSYTVADGYKAAVYGRPTENSAAASGLDIIPSAFNSANGLCYMPRSYTQLGTAVTGQRFGDNYLLWNTAAAGTGSSYQGPVPFPNPSTSGLHLAAVRIQEGSTSAMTTYRGEMRGFFHQVHPAASFADGDVFSGVGDFTGRSFLLIKFVGAATGVGVGVACVETTDWPASP